MVIEPRAQRSNAERYELGAAIAAGGMGTIYEAFDRFLGRHVAYKRLRVASEVDRARLTVLLRREYDTLARLDHPNIVSAYEYGYDALEPYYAMELLSGDDLSKLAPLSFRDGCRVFRDVASALALLHARRLIHRDVSPNNVRLASERRAKLIDFGGLMAFGAPTEIVGTPAFMAPECLTGEPLDQRSDLYSLGALAYWLFTRRLAVRAHSLEELAAAWPQPLSPPSRWVPELPRGIDELVLSLLDRDRVARPATAGAVIERLTNLADLDTEESESKVAFSYLKHTLLRGRDDARGTIDQALDTLSAGRGAVLRMEGAPGSGRSALLEHLIIAAQLRGAVVLRTEGSVQRGPLGAAKHLLTAGLAVYPDLAQTYRAQHSSRSELDASVQRRERARSAFEAAEQQGRTLSSMQEALLQLSLRHPLVLVVDDIQLVDRPSLALLASLLEPMARHPLLIALADLKRTASDEAEAHLRAQATNLELPPLAEAEVTDLIDTMFGGVPNTVPFGRCLHADTAGNPAHCLELVRELLERGSIRYLRGTFTLPREPQRELAAARSATSSRTRLSGLSPPTIRVATLLGLYEGALDLEQLEQASGLAIAGVLTALDELVERGLALASGGEYALASPVVRTAFTDAIGDEDARMLHLALAGVLQAKPQPSLADRLAAGLHLIRAGGAEARTGAAQIEELARVHRYEVVLSGTAVPHVEAALAVLRADGMRDEACAQLLATLSVSGFFGELGAQRRHLARALKALYGLAGFALAARLRPWLGGRVALVVGIVAALLARAYARGRGRRVLSLPQSIEQFLNVAGSATAALTAIDEPDEAARIVRWLDPLAGARASSALGLLRTFCAAVAATADSRFKQARTQYLVVLQGSEKRVPGLDDRARAQLRLGCLHGLGQSLLTIEPESARAYADELAKGSPFFAPHAASIRMSYHGYRGELEEADRHRRESEALALVGGASWTASVILTVRSYHISLLTEDVINLAQSSVEFSRLATLSPRFLVQRELAEAHLMVLRGRTSEALPIYAGCIDRHLGESSSLRAVNAMMYARALREAGRPAAALAMCDEQLPLIADGERDQVDFVALSQQRALAVAALGDRVGAAAALERLIAHADALGNPRTLGSLHRDRTEVAVLAHDVASFEKHFASMTRWFAATRNPWLMQQCDVLLTRATHAGIRAAPAVDQRYELPHQNDEMDGATVVEEQVARPCRQGRPENQVEHAAGDDDTKRKVS